MNTIAVFLNRNCPRNCPQCAISDASRPPLSLPKWKEAFEIINGELGISFFLILGTEPLMMGDDFVELIKWFNKKKFFYGLYSTSPQPLFDRYKYKLLDVGLNNWSCGIDTIPGDYPSDLNTKHKVKDGLNGMKFMASHGVQTLALTTVTNINLGYIPEIIEYCQENIPGILSCINPVEWRHNNKFDFFSTKEQMKNLIIPLERKGEVQGMIEKVLGLSRRPGYQIQNTDAFLLDYADYYTSLDYRCNGIVGMGVDCDGSFRLCGYSKGEKVNRYFVWDLPTHRAEILRDWESDANICEGCHWSYVYSLLHSFDTLVPKSLYYTERHKQPLPIVER